jgi:DNA anti-recombination protein RmuC
LEAISAKLKSDRLVALEIFAAQIKRPIENLSSKNYWQQFQNCPELVISFLPEESFLGDTFRANAELLEFGQKNV